MLSGNGRHRRPRQAPAFVVTAGVTGSALALPLLVGTAAHAADGATWDRLADCESGGAWSANGGNGYYGGLQLTLADWERYGGTDYAERPDLASRSQQISVAERILDDRGAAVWAACAAVAELTEDGPDPSVDPGVPESEDSDPTRDPAPEPTESAEPTETSDPTGSPEPTETPNPDGSTDPTDPTDSTDPTDPTDDPASPGAPGPTPEPSSGPSDEPGDEPSGQPGGESPTSPSESTGPADSPSPTNPDDSDDSGADEDNSPGTGDGSHPAPSPSEGSVEDGSGRHRGDPAPEEDADERPGRGSGRHSRPGDAPAGAEGSYTVRAGDSLWAIAEAHDIDGGWPELYALNRQTVGVDPDLVLPGQTLSLGSETDAPQG